MSILKMFKENWGRRKRFKSLVEQLKEAKE
jgi:hypothetical protein